MNYAVGFINTTANRSDRELKVNLYNKNNELINTHNFYWGEDNIFKHIAISDLIVENEKVYASLKAFNLDMMYHEKGKFIIVDCSEKNTKNTQFSIIENDNDSPEMSLLKYSKNDNTIYVATQYKDNKESRKLKEDSWSALNKMYVYNPTTKIISLGNEIKFPYVEHYSNSLIGLYLDNDNFYVNYENGNGYPSYSRGANIIIQNSKGSNSPKFSFVDKYHDTGNPLTFKDDFNKDDKLYKGSFYIDGKNYKLLLLNDDIENEKKYKAGKSVKPLEKMKDCDAFYCQTNSSQLAPSRNYLFSEKENIIKTTSCYFNKSNQIFATIARKSKGEELTIVWFKID